MYDPFNHEMLGCIRYDSHSAWDTNFKLARANAVFLLFSLSVVTILHTLSMLFLLQERRKLIIHWICRGFILPSLVFNTLLFIVFGGDDCHGPDMKCPPGAGAILAIFNEFVLFAMAVLCLLVPPPTYPYFLRYSSVFQEGREGSVFSVPEIIKAKRTIQQEHHVPQKQQQQQKPATHRTKRHASTTSSSASVKTDMAQNNNKSAHHHHHAQQQGNHRDGSSSSTLVTDDVWDEEDPHNNYAQKYCAPSRSPVRQCV